MPSDNGDKNPLSSQKKKHNYGMSGGKGDHQSHSELAMIQRAIKNEWPLTDEMRAIVVEQMGDLVVKSFDPRAKVAAAKVLAQVDRVNVQRESNLIAEERALIGETHQHVHFEALNAGRDLISQVLAELEHQPEGPDTPGSRSNGSGRGNGHAGGNGSGSTP